MYTRPPAVGYGGNSSGLAMPHYPCPPNPRYGFNNRPEGPSPTKLKTLPHPHLPTPLGRLLLV